VDPYESVPRVTASERDFLVCWTQNSRLLGARIDPSGELLDPEGIVIREGHCDNPSPAAHGHDFVVAWDDGASIFAARLDQSGSVLDTVPITVCVSSPMSRCPEICSSENCYLVSWQTIGFGWDIWAARLSFEGILLDPDPVRICSASNLQYEVSIASRSSRFLMAWEDYRSLDFDIYGEFLGSPDIQETPYDPREHGVEFTGAPNPFSDRVRLSIHTEVQGEMSQSVYDASGCRVRRIFSGVLEPGTVTVEWNGRDSGGQVVPSGAYFVVLVDESGSIQTLRLVKTE
jgi:hypothetical protein